MLFRSDVKIRQLPNTFFFLILSLKIKLTKDLKNYYLKLSFIKEPVGKAGSPAAPHDLKLVGAWL